MLLAQSICYVCVLCLVLCDAMEDQLLFESIAFSGTVVTDKVTRHRYQEMYGHYLLPFIRKKHEKNLGVKFLEIGLGCGMEYGAGASVDIWKKLLTYPSDELWEAEHNGVCVDHANRNNMLEGVNVLVGNQEDIATLNRWVSESGGSFDVIVDDGGHQNHQIYNSFSVLWEAVAPGGLYFIEDLHAGRDKGYSDATERGIVMGEFISSWIEQLIFEKFTGDPLKKIPPGIKWITCQWEACIIAKCDVDDVAWCSPPIPPIVAPESVIEGAKVNAALVKTLYKKVRLEKWSNILSFCRDNTNFAYSTHVVENREVQKQLWRQRHVSLIDKNLDFESLEYPAKFFDFVYSRHALADMENPIRVFKELVRVGIRGLIETSSPIAESLILGNVAHTRGYRQHRFLFWTDSKTNTLFVLPKLPVIDHTDIYDTHREHLLIQLLNEQYPLFSNYYQWNETLLPSMKLLNVRSYNDLQPNTDLSSREGAYASYIREGGAMTLEASSAFFADRNIPIATTTLY